MAEKIYRFVIKEDEDSELGVDAISLVQEPAMESNFIAFNKQQKKELQKFISLEKFGDDYKQVVAGLALIPDKLIFRVDPDTNEGYYGFFDVETIEKIRNKFHSNPENQKNVNLNHDDAESIDAYMLESYILDSEDRINDAKNKGIDEAVTGAWFTAYKIKDEEVFQKVLDGDVKGFSIEAYLEKQFITEKMNKINNNNTQNLKKMKENLVEKLKNKFNELLEEVIEEKEEGTDTQKFEDAVVPESGQVIRFTNAGEAVLIVSTDDAGNEVTEAAPQGEYVLEDGRTVVVDESGNLIEVQDAPAAPASGSTEAASGSTEVASKEEVMANASGQTDTLPEAVITYLNAVAGSFEDGELYLSFYKESNEWKYGSVSTWADIKMTKEQKAEVDKLQKEIKGLKEKMSEAIADPILSDEKDGKEEIKPASVYEMIAKREGLPTV